MSGYKLYYFNSRGRGEFCRLAFAAAKVEYEDIRLDHEQWAKEKAYLSPTDCFDEAFADMITDGVQDLFSALVNSSMEPDEVKKAKLTKEFFETTFPARLEKFQSIFKDRNGGKGFFMGDKLCYADIVFFSLCNVFARGQPTVPEQLKKFPLLVELYNRVLNVPEIRAWVEKRPKTDG